MAHMTLLSYRADDLPGCLAAAGLVRALARYAGYPVRLAWGAMHPALHLPDGLTRGEVFAALTAIAVARADSPHWSLLDACDDAATWERAAQQVYASDPRDGGDFLAAAGCYLGGEGGRSPLICTARNMTPGRWARKSVTAAAATDWEAHFARWSEAGGSWQGWRPVGGADPAAVWLALEGLAYYSCSLVPAWQRPRPTHRDIDCDIEGVGMAPPYEPARRRDVRCPGWDAGRREWSYPLPRHPVGADGLRSYIGSPAIDRHMVFRRSTRRAGNYDLAEFGPGVPRTAAMENGDG